MYNFLLINVSVSLIVSEVLPHMTLLTSAQGKALVRPVDH